MRTPFIKTLTQLARSDDRIVLLTGDLGFMVIEEFAAEFPTRFYNVGVAEANMMGLAAGLAAEGLLPFCYSIATFASMRGYEHLRDGAALHQLPVRVVGVGGGFAYGSAGPTHHALEDIAIMRALPQMTVIAPVDDRQTVNALRKTYDLDGPIYYRLHKDSFTVEQSDGDFDLERIDTHGTGSVLLVTAGAMTTTVFKASQALRSKGIANTVAAMATLSPVPNGALLDALSGKDVVVTIEDHCLTGGVGSIVAEVMAENACTAKLLRFGVDRRLDGIGGSEKFLLKSYGLDADSIAASVVAALPAESAA